MEMEFYTFYENSRVYSIFQKFFLSQSDFLKESPFYRDSIK